LQLEIAEPEADEIELVPVAVGISDFGLDGPERVACLSLRYQVAQKLHAVTEQPPDRPNLRFWDLIDLVLLEALLDDDLTPVREAATSIFRARGTHTWPPELIAPDAWREPYAASAAEIEAGVPASLDEAAVQVRGLIDAIASA
jgi:hypothetical protein